MARAGVPAEVGAWEPSRINDIWVQYGIASLLRDKETVILLQEKLPCTTPTSSR